MSSVSASTSGIRVIVDPFYHDDVSKPSLKRFVHSYTVTIENRSERQVQLKSRHWIITEAGGDVREVKGEGVVGETPVLNPGDTFSYNSWCPIKTPMGKMGGTYTMVYTDNLDSFIVDIPEFKLIANFKLN